MSTEARPAAASSLMVMAPLRLMTRSAAARQEAMSSMYSLTNRWLSPRMPFSWQRSWNSSTP